ncbi:TniQ family protein [Limimaricola cinnabarinus]|uniref:TniQ family protein n=1 Tax=Limimaricola cinnabarinus TaxID=1125964 RepID=UPI002FE1D2BC
MTSLPTANPDPASRETVFSYLSRLAATWRTDIVDFAHDIGTSFRRLLAQDQDACDGLADWANLDRRQMAEMLSWTGERAGNVRMRFRGEMLVSRALRNPAIRGCPVCLREDALQHYGPSTAAMVMRGDWQLREANVCIRHRHPLVTLWKTENPRDRYDFYSRLREIEADILSGRLDQAEIRPSGYDRWLDGRLQDGRDDTWLKGHSLFAATTFIRLLGQALLHGDKQNHARDIGAAHNAGFEVARHGEATISQTLNRMAAAATGHLDEPKKAFGAMYPALSKDYLEENGFERFRELLRECILNHWPVAAGDVLMGKVVTERRLHSVVTAAREIGIGAQVVEHHLIDAGAIQTSDERPRSRKTFDAEAYADLLAEIPALVGSLTLRRAMGATKREFEGLVEEGVLAPRTRMPGVRHPWRLSDGLDLVDELRAKANLLSAIDDEWETLLHSGQRTGISLSALVDAIRGDRLTVAKTEGDTGFHGFVVSKAEVHTAALFERRPEASTIDLPGEMSAAEFGRTVGLRDRGNFASLIEAGHTPAEIHINPKTGRSQYRLSANDILQFHRRFVTLPTFARETGQHPNTLKGLLAKANISHFSPCGQDFGPVYLRSEASSVLF